MPRKCSGRRLASLAVALLAVSLPLPTTGTSEPLRIVISEVFSDPDAARGEREFIELWNQGAHAVQLQGWKLRDAPTASGNVNTFTFPAWSLPAGGRLVVWGGGAADSLGPAWSNAAAWNNAGDAVHLLAPDGSLVDWVGYGATIPPPAGFEAAIHPKPARSESLQLDGDLWTLAAPTPGTALGVVAGALQVTIANAPPAARFVTAPRSIRPGSQPVLHLVADDPNGIADIAQWSLRSGTTVLASGAGGGHLNVTVTAPRAAATWTLHFLVTDRAGLAAEAQHVVNVRFSDLVVETPDGKPLPFPEALPGQRTVAPAQPIQVRNLAEHPLVPLLDVSPFSGPASFPARGHLEVGWPAESGNVTWRPYEPLMPLPAIPGNSTLHVSFRLRDLPVPMPAGPYGSSFTVVAR
jgi:hypothetical protein